ncbi:MAG: hypothetical protein LBI13_05795 [Streptococcaceae bacterium]|jgi:hypothetical protein|nr:hypothetical protein [Streptococcaceae bacterium]
MPRKRRKALLSHAIGIFALIIAWLFLLVFKNSLGNLKIPVFLTMIVITIVGIYLLSSMLLKGLKSD